MNIIYTIKWTQPYYGWLDWKMQEVERKLQNSDFAEARSVIERILKNDRIN